jgi:hypothetical protein
MRLPAGHERYDYSIRTATDRLAHMLRHDITMYGEVHPVAVHLHMHNHGRQTWLEHHRGGQQLAEVGRIDQYKGFGVDQSFFVVDASMDRAAQEHSAKEAADGHFTWRPTTEGIREGDQLAMHCVFDTRCRYATPLNDANCEKAAADIHYGLSHGDEMCGALMMYYPHDPTVRFWNANVLGYERGDLVSHGAVLEPIAPTA